MKPSDTHRHEISEADMVAHLFGDAHDAEAVEAALAGSPELRRTYDELRRTLDLVDEDPVPRRGDDYGADVWRRLEGRLNEADRVAEVGDDRATVVSFPAPRRADRARPIAMPAWLGLAAAAVLLLAAGFLLGRLGTTSPDDTIQVAADDDLPALSDGARERLLTAALSEHLGRSERLLTEIANASDTTSRSVTDSDLERVWAEELLVSNRLYRRAAEAAGQKRIARLLTELEPVLLELAHADPGHVERSADEMSELRQRVDEQGLLFKVRVTERRLAPLDSI